MADTLLAGLRVVEISQLIAASFCGLTLADYGADVVKVEPAEGEYARTIEPPLSTGESAYFQMLNRGKRSLAVDYRDADALDVVRRLVAEADIVVENLGDAAGSLGLTYEAFAAERPDLIWCSVTGTGTGTAGRAIDPTLQASMGMMALNGEPDGRPLRLPVPLVDFMTGMYAVQSVLAAVLRVRAGEGGRYLDCALLDAAATLACSAGVYALGSDEPLRRMGTENNWYVPASNFRGSDGGWIQLMAISEFHWRAICRVVGHPEWLENPRLSSNAARVANRDQVHAVLAEEIAQRPAHEWVVAFTEAGAFCAPVREIEDAWADHRLADRRLVMPVTGEARFPIPVASLARSVGEEPMPRAARLGEHSVEIATELGIERERLDALRTAGSLVAPATAQGRVARR